jgi:flagellar motor switch protein FliN/FliY
MPTDSEKPPQGKSDKAHEVSQGEVDALLKGGSSTKNSKSPASGQEAAGGAPPVNEAEIDALLAQASASPEPPKAQEQAGAFPAETVQPQVSASEKPSVDLLMDVGLNVRVELGRRKMFVEDILKLTKGSVVELDKLAGDPLDILVNDKLVAQGEVLVLNDNFCIRITNILSPGGKKE